MRMISRTARARLPRVFARLSGNKSGIALTEFALSLPLLMGVGLYGTETANVALVNMRVSQAALQIADNASRVGEASQLAQRRIYERDINDLLLGSNIQAGTAIDLYEHGRVIISSLEMNEDGGQWIHWQRCKGKKRHNSTYGNAGQGATGDDFPGMGKAGEELTALEDDAVIFVEVSYDYQPLVDDVFTGGARVVNTTAAFNVRDARDLSQIYQRDPDEPDPVARCNVYDGFEPAA